MAGQVFTADTRRNPAEDTHQFVTELQASGQAHQQGRLAQQQEQRLQRSSRLAEVQAAMTVLDQFTPEARAAGTRSLLSNLASTNELPMLTDFLKTNPQIRGKSIDELRNQLALEASETMTPAQRTEVGASVIRDRNQASSSSTLGLEYRQHQDIQDALSDPFVRSRYRNQLKEEGLRFKPGEEAAEIDKRITRDRTVFGGSTARNMGTENPSQQTVPVDTRQSLQPGGSQDTGGPDAFEARHGRTSRDFVRERLEYYLSQNFSEEEAVTLASKDLEDQAGQIALDSPLARNLQGESRIKKQRSGQLGETMSRMRGVPSES